ncbi:hypothetical protein [Psychromicrobium xiongbiense]|uniref:hypothetical protein n=1 Tax=Psychromicrobium xiongbiense TaxID=3051184 RepID=UPI002556D2B7|nr:hypothetical protein [Psychromicrobium sp. YIM S02556]
MTGNFIYADGIKISLAQFKRIVERHTEFHRERTALLRLAKARGLTLGSREKDLAATTDQLYRLLRTGEQPKSASTTKDAVSRE